MSTTPTSTPPLPPRRSGSNLLWVLLGVVLFGGVLAFTGIYIFARYLAREVIVDVRNLPRGGKSISVETPKGSFRLDAGEVSEAQLGMPIYPGARRRKEHGATISIEVPSEKSVLVAAAEFETDDPLDKVAAFYRERLGDSASEHRRDGGVEFKIKGEEGRVKVVGLRRYGTGTRIGMANVTEAETN